MYYKSKLNMCPIFSIFQVIQSLYLFFGGARYPFRLDLESTNNKACRFNAAREGTSSSSSAIPKLVFFHL